VGTRKRTAGTGTIIARSNGTFTAQISEGSRRRSIGTFGTRIAAEKALASAMVEGPPPTLDCTFAQGSVGGPRRHHRSADEDES